MFRITVFYNKKPSIAPKAKKIIQDLKLAGYKVDIERLRKNTDLAIALGGDGTYLRVAHKVKARRIPLLAVKLGRLGFLSEISGNNVVDAVKLFENKKYKIDRRYLLNIKIKRKNTTIYQNDVLNDAVLSRCGISRLFDINVVANKKTNHFRADGVIIASPTGSTAYNLSAGGPMIEPVQKKYIVTPICPHAVGWKSVVVSDIVTTKIIPGISKKISLEMTFDGASLIKLKKDSVIEINKSKLFVDFVRFKPYNFKRIFKEKFGKK